MFVYINYFGIKVIHLILLGYKVLFGLSSDYESILTS